MQGLDYWDRRFDKLFPDGLTFEQTEQANSEIWQNVYPTREMAEDEVPETIRIVKQGK
jgi:hypothetical protein